MRRNLFSTLIFVVGSAYVTTATADAAAPVTDVVPIDVTFTAPQASAVCGFTVTRHTEGQLTIRTFSDSAGNFARELDHYRLVETISANGKTLTGHTVQNISVDVLPGGFFTVAFVGSDFLLPVPGAGMAFGTVGRLVLLFAPDGTLIGVQQDVGNTEANYSAICEALAP